MDREAADEIAIRRGALPGPRTDGRPGAAPFEAMGGKITINLPRAAFRSARDGRNSIRSELEEALDIAIKGHLERRRFIERLGSNRENPLWDLLGGGDAAPLLDLAGMKFSIGLLGLNEAVKYLTGHEMHQDPEAASLGIEIVRGILGKVRNEERSLGLRIILEETANVGPLRGLERADRLRHPQAVEVERGREARWGPAYTDGVRPHRMAPMDPLRRIEELAPYLRYVEPAGGIIEDLPELRGAAGGLLMALLEECVASPVVAALRGEMEEG